MRESREDLLERRVCEGISAVHLCYLAVGHSVEKQLFF
jgi:hypothetical protein